jgi:hypothetical protein
VVWYATVLLSTNFQQHSWTVMTTFAKWYWIRSYHTQVNRYTSYVGIPFSTVLNTRLLYASMFLCFSSCVTRLASSKVQLLEKYVVTPWNITCTQSQVHKVVRHPIKMYYTPSGLLQITYILNSCNSCHHRNIKKSPTYIVFIIE